MNCNNKIERLIRSLIKKNDSINKVDNIRYTSLNTDRALLVKDAKNKLKRIKTDIKTKNLSEKEQLNILLEELLKSRPCIKLDDNLLSLNSENMGIWEKQLIKNKTILESCATSVGKIIIESSKVSAN